jgi:transcription initiation factor TFIIIB Brf1 subunit/transcription initiation factor TFIIB
LQELAPKAVLTKQKKRPWFCALVYLASREEGATQTIRDIAQANADYRRTAASSSVRGVRKDVPTAEKAANTTALENSIAEQVKELTKQLGLAKTVMYAEDPELMTRLVARLQLAPQCAKPASHIVQESYRQGKLLGARINKVSQDTLMAAAIFIVAWLLDVEQKPEIRYVASIARVNPSQVIDAYLVVRPKLRYLMPKDFVCRLRDGIEGLPVKPKL